MFYVRKANGFGKNSIQIYLSFPSLVEYFNLLGKTIHSEICVCVCACVRMFIFFLFLFKSKNYMIKTFEAKPIEARSEEASYKKW